MSPSETAVPLESFTTFGDLLKYLRRRARLTQREVAISVGYSEAQVSRLEQNQRLPELSSLVALFIPALYLEDEPETIARLLELAAQARGENLPVDGSITFARSVREETLEKVRTVEEDSLNNLPFQLTNFIGREREMAEIQTLFETARLITLIGSGGCGKTRLALEGANRHTGKHRDGIWFVDLSSISDGNLVPQAVASALGLSLSREEAPFEAITKYLKAKNFLLILDNCEQILSAAAHIVEEILRTCRNVQILATSRQVLGIAGEVRFRVPSLALPKETELGSDVISQFESVQLFVDRARAVLPAFSLTTDNASAIAQICQRVDGMPLGIELAAARTTALSVPQIAARLENSFQLLTGGKSIPRHEALLATIDWSYELLPESERDLLQQLSVFVGGWTLEAAEAVTDCQDVLNGLSQLVDKSLVVVDFQRYGETRYHLPASVREYSHGRLLRSGKLDKLETRHFDFFLHLAEMAEAGFKGSDHQNWLQRLDMEQDNIRAALRYGISAGRFESTLVFTGTLFWYWQTLGYISEGRSHVKEALRSGHESHADQTTGYAKALWCAGGLSWIQGDYVEAKSLLDESIALWRRLGDIYGVAAALREAGIVATYRGELEPAHVCLQESISLLQEIDRKWDLALAFYNRGLVYESQNDPRTAREHFEQSQLLFRGLKEPWGLSVALFGLGRISGRQADYTTANFHLEESLELSRRLDDPWSNASILYLLGEIALRQNEIERAIQLYLESLRLNQTVGDKAMIGFTLHSFGKILQMRGDLDQAAQFFGAAESLRDDSTNTTSWSLTDMAQCQRDIANLRATMQEGFNLPWIRGQAMDGDEAIAMAMAISNNSGSHSP